MGNVLVVGSLNVDLVMRSERMPAEGETLTGGSFARFTGGKGANQAVAAARLGAAVTMVGSVGDDSFGAESIRALERNAVDVRHVRRLPNKATGVAFILLDAEGRNRIIVSPGANHVWDAAVVPALQDKFSRADVIVVQLEVPLDVVTQTLELANEVGTPVILNPAPAQVLATGLLARVRLLTPNEVELGQLVGRSLRGLDDIKGAAHELMACGVQSVVVTLGERGALVIGGSGENFGEDEMVEVDGYPVRAVDTVGAGDAFNGALATKLAYGTPLVTAARFANAVAAIAVTREGAQSSMPTSHEVAEFLRNREG